MPLPLRPRAFAPLAALLAACVLVPAARAQQPAAARAPQRIPPLYPGRFARPVAVEADTSGLRFRVDEMRLDAGAPARSPVSDARRLTPAEAQRVFARLRPLRATEADADSFYFPAETLPPPRAGRVLADEFTPRLTAGGPARPVVRAPAALEVVRRAPEGPVDDEAAEVTVTFSQPMVPLASLGAVRAQAVPVRLTPRPAGEWRWLDTRTLRFEPRSALPAATGYRVEVVAGTRSAAGAPLAETVAWTFSTRAPKATGAWPQGQPTGFTPVLLVAFDQRVDPAAVLPSVHLRAGTASVPLRLATAAEVAADTQAASLSTGLPAGQWAAFRAAAALPGDADVRVSVGPGTPSAEGPRTTEVEQYWEFRTHGAFRVLSPECDSCRARQAVALYFSNPIAPRSFRPEGVRVEPAIAGMEAWVSENLLIISGDTRANTRYAVHLDSGLRDVFGQALDSAGPVAVNVVLPFAAVGAPRGVVVLDPAGARTVTVMTIAHARVRLRLMRVRPEDWFSFRDLGWSSRRPATLPGTVAVDREVAIDASDGDPHPLDVDLSPALAGGLGQALVAVEALDGADQWEREQAAYVWVQATRIGLGAFADAAGLTAWTTSLVDGSPLAGARVQLIGRDTVDETRTRVQGSAVADARGVAALTLPPGGTREQRLLVARAGGDVAILTPEMVQRWAGEWLRGADPPTRVWHGFTDRTLYRPGETVHFKGWLRTIADVHGGGPELPRVGPSDSVAWTAFDGEENEIARGRAPLTALGGFDGAFTVPGGANLGEAYVALRPAPHRERASDADGAAVDEDDQDPEDDDYSARVEYRIDEFRRPEYTVAATASDGVHFVGGTVEVTARATYFAGGVLPGAPVAWDVTASPASFVPPGWEEWSFGDGSGGSRTMTLAAATDARGSSAVHIALQRADPPVPYVVEASATVTDVNRQTWTSQAIALVHPASVYVGLRARHPWVQRGDSIHLEMAAVDLDGRAVAGRTLRVGMVARAWREQGGRWTEEVVDSSAAACVRVSVPQPVRCAFLAARAGWYQLTATTTDERGRPTRSSTRVWVMGGGIFAPPGPENEARRVDLVPDKPSYAVGDTARILLRTRFFPSSGLVTVRRNGIVRTQRIRVAESTATFAVPIGEADVPNSWIGVDLVGEGAGGEGARGVDHASGEVSLSVPPATRVLSVRALPRDSVSAPDARTAVELRVRDARGRPVAGAEVALAVVDEAVLALAGYRPPNPLEAFYRQRNAGVRTVDLRTLVQVYAPDFAPAAGTLVGRVTDAATGGPLGGATVTVKGTSLLARTDDAGRFRIAGVAPGRYTVDVQMSGFEEARLPVMVGDAPPPPVRVALVSSDGVRIRIRGANSQPLSLQSIVTNAVALEGVLVAKAPGVEIGSSRAPIAVRANFDPLAVFTPAVRTDREGRAVVPFTLPSNLTRYRVIAVAVHGGTLYGVGQAAITARQPLMVRPSAPRFLNWGDRFELPVVLQNQTGAPVQADVAVRADGIEMLDAGRRVTVPAHDRVEVRLRASAARVGEATLQVAAASPGGPADAAEVTVPVYTPATAESFATYGTFTGDSAVALPLEVPGDAIPGFGGLEVSASSTALQELTDALLYLVTYPYECSEQVASRLLGVTALRDVLSSFGARALPAPEALRASVQRDVRMLAGRQSATGAVGLWEEGDVDFPYVSIHAAHALQRAREKGYDVPSEAATRALAYLRAVPGNVPAWYPLDVRRALHAYALYVRARMDDSTAAGAVRAFMAETPRDSVTVEVAGWLLSAAATDPRLAAEREELLRIVNNAATETASTATFATRYTDGEYLLLHSARRTDGVVLEGLLAAQPANPLVPKVVRGLLGHRVRGRWENTQENGWVLVALDRYFRAFEGQTPDFVARVWLGDRYAGGHRFAGRQTDRWQLPVPMRVLQELRPDALTIGKEGEGRVYFRAGLRYAPRALELPPLEAGFAVSRRYDAVDDPADVRQDSAGAWHVRAGARVRVTLTMTAPSRRLHVALVDPLPAGFEAVNAELQGARPVPPGPPDARSGDWEWWWRRYWYEHQNLRDQRAEAFTSLLRAGTYTWSYLARATTPGAFVAPPPHAEEMYAPETFGRGASDRVMVEAP